MVRWSDEFLHEKHALIYAFMLEFGRMVVNGNPFPISECEESPYYSLRREELV